MNSLKKAASSTLSISNELDKNKKSVSTCCGYDDRAIVSPNPEEEHLLCSLDNVPLFSEDFFCQSESRKRKNSNDEEQIINGPISVDVESPPFIIPMKKRKTSDSQKFTRSQKSYGSLVTAFVDIEPSESCQPMQGSQFKSSVPPDADYSRGAVNAGFSKDFNSSLIFQLHYVSSTASSESSASPAQSLENISCPNRGESLLSNGDSGASPGSKSNQAQYGWFVELDENDNEEAAYAAENCYKTSAGCELAFRAPTAPKRSHYEDQVEWAYAADTVDDVLGDFF